MTEWHADREMIERFLREELAEEESLTLERHLLTCSECEELLVEALPARPVVNHLHGEAYRLLVRRALREMRSEGEQRRILLAAERRQAGQLWQEMQSLNAAARRELVWEDSRFQSWGFFELLVDKARSMVLEEPRQAEESLRLALDVTEHLDSETYGAGSVESAKARAWASLGNALRVLADFRQAELAFNEAEAHLANGWHDPLDEALLLEYRASLRRAQRRFDEALQLLNAAIALYREIKEPHGQGRATMAKGLVLRYAGEAEAASGLFRESLLLLDGNEEPRLLALSHANLIGSLLDSGRVREAAALIPEARKLVAEFGKRTDERRLRWLEGICAANLGNSKEAEAIFLELIEVFTKDRHSYDVALLSLELAGVYARQGRTADVKRLAAEMLPVFQSFEIHREALAALIVFQKAAEMEQLSVGLVEEVTTFLQRARTNPSLRFREDERGRTPTHSLLQSH